MLVIFGGEDNKARQPDEQYQGIFLLVPPPSSNPRPDLQIHWYNSGCTAVKSTQINGRGTTKHAKMASKELENGRGAAWGRLGRACVCDSLTVQACEHLTLFGWPHLRPITPPQPGGATPQARYANEKAQRARLMAAGE